MKRRQRRNRKRGKRMENNKCRKYTTSEFFLKKTVLSCKYVGIHCVIRMHCLIKSPPQVDGQVAAIAQFPTQRDQRRSGKIKTLVQGPQQGFHCGLSFVNAHL